MNKYKIKLILKYSFFIMGLCCMFTEIIINGVYVYGDDATLFIIGMLSCILGLVI